MTRQVKILLAVFTACLLGIVVNLTWIQLLGSERISGNAANKRRLVEEYAVERGDIISADGQVVARSVDTGGEYRYQREYPLGPLFANVTGYDSWKYGRTGVEKEYNAELLGRGPRLTFRSIANGLLGASKKGDSVVLTVDSRLQRAAADALGDSTGAVVAMNPRTGAVLAMVTSPTYDPNSTVPVPGRDTGAEWAAINANPGKPLLDRCLLGLYPPGSSFKVVTAAAALDSGVATPGSEFDCEGKLEVSGFTLYDFSRSGHGRIDLARALVVSCNVTFAQVGLLVGAQTLVSYAEAFGFNNAIPFDLPVARSHIQKADTMDPVALAASAIGQAEDIATPLQMAMVAAAVANDGVAPKPYLVSEFRDYNGKIVEQFRPGEWREVMDGETASVLTGMMVEAVEDGTGTAARIDGVEVAGKTGTAETGVPGAGPHAWFICFAPALDPEVAVAVVVENGGEGGKVAAPIARDVLERALEL